MDNRGRKPDTWTLRRGFTISGNTFDFACHGPRPLKEGEEIVVVMLSEYLDLHAQRGAVSADEHAALLYLANGLESLGDGTVRVIPGAITADGLREARAATERGAV